MTDLHLLLVDDMPSAERQIRSCLEGLGLRVRMDYRCPSDATVPFGCELPNVEQLDEFDLALVDLELFPAEDLVEYKRDDLRGGTEILPHLRQQAPWLPIIAESRLYGSSAQHFFAIAGAFGFDGHIPRNLFSESKITRGLWDELVTLAERNRLETVVGWNGATYDPVGDRDIEISRPDEARLDAAVPGWRKVASTIFHFGSRIVLEVLPGGFSGAQVARAVVTNAHDSMRGEWVLKLSRSASKLQQEASAHLAMVRSGVEFARAVQLLWPRVIRRGRAAGIAYQFARGSVEASKWAKQHGIGKLGIRLRPMLTSLYGKPAQLDSVLAKSLEPWLPAKEILAKAASVASPVLSQLLGHIMSEGLGCDFGKVAEISKARIHGDLHLDNILVGDPSDVLIDFARSSSGPIVEDLAKVLTHVLTWIPESRVGFKLASPLDSEGLKPLLEPLSDLFIRTGGDAKLLPYALTAHVARTLSYESTPNDARAWLISVS